MTALAGFLSFDGSLDPQMACSKMIRAQTCYGNRDEITWTGDQICLGRRPFDILPEDKFVRSPIVGGDGNLVLIADVRLDNREDLARALNISGDALHNLSDSGLIMKCWEAYEDEAVHHLIGDYAFVLWDRRHRRLNMVRDYIGQRPLHFHRGDDFIAFASMPKGIHAIEQVPYAPDATAMADFIALMPESDDRSFFANIEKVQAGHIVTISKDRFERKRYWSPPEAMLRLRSSQDYSEAVREQFDRAVASRLRGSSGHAATHLSAGLDSSSVTATAAQLLLRDAGKVTAFTSVPREGYPGSSHCIVDEGPLAAETASLYPNVEHVLIRSGGRSPLSKLDRNFYLYDRPLLNLTNFVWIDAIRDAAKARGISVLLTGSMGNHTFSYSGMELLPDLLARGRFISLAQHLIRLRRGGVRAGTLAAQVLGPFLPRDLWLKICDVRGRPLRITDYTAIRSSAVTSHGIGERAIERGLDLSYRPRRNSLATRLWALGGVDLGNYNKGALAGWGIDTRDPTADRRLVELCLSIPAEQYLEGGQTRSIARRAMADRLPRSVLQQRLKGYQAADWHDGLHEGRQQLSEEVERLAACPAAAEMLNVARLNRLMGEWPTNGWQESSTAMAYRIAMLRGVSAGHFLRKAVGSNQ